MRIYHSMHNAQCTIIVSACEGDTGGRPQSPPETGRETYFDFNLALGVKKAQKLA